MCLVGVRAVAMASGLLIAIATVTLGGGARDVMHAPFSVKLANISTQIAASAYPAIYLVAMELLPQLVLREAAPARVMQDGLVKPVTLVRLRPAPLDNFVTHQRATAL